MTGWPSTPDRHLGPDGYSEAENGGTTIVVACVYSLLVFVCSWTLWIAESRSVDSEIALRFFMFHLNLSSRDALTIEVARENRTGF